MGNVLSMMSRAEVTTRYATVYVKALRHNLNQLTRTVTRNSSTQRDVTAIWNATSHRCAQNGVRQNDEGRLAVAEGFEVSTTR